MIKGKRKPEKVDIKALAKVLGISEIAIPLNKKGRKSKTKLSQGVKLQIPESESESYVHIDTNRWLRDPSEINGNWNNHTEISPITWIEGSAVGTNPPPRQPLSNEEIKDIIQRVLELHEKGDIDIPVPKAQTKEPEPEHDSNVSKRRLEV